MGSSIYLRVPYRGSVADAVKDFHGIHEARYGFSSPEEEVEIVVARLEAVGVTDKPVLGRRERGVLARLSRRAAAACSSAVGGWSRVFTV